MALTELAEAAYARSDPATAKEKWSPAVLGGYTNPDRFEVMMLAVSDCADELHRAVQALSGEPDLEIFLPQLGRPDPTLVYPGGSVGQSFDGLVSSLLVSTAQRLYFLGQESTPASFVRGVIENYDELLRAGRGEAVRCYDLLGYTGITLHPGSQVVTPWGVLRPAPPNFKIGFGFNATTAILSSPRLMNLVVTREEVPVQLSVEGISSSSIEGARQLLPIAFALATSGTRPCAPMITFETRLLPLVEVHSYSLPGVLLPTQQPVAPSEEEFKSAEDWARRLEESRNGSLQIAERRLVSAIAQRSDKADSLIDAVVAWESLVGTRTETVFRVTAALAKLLEKQPELRYELRRKLTKVYDVRSSVIHGDLVDNDDIAAASEEAIEVGLEALRVLHDRSGDWLTLKSGQRADRLILDD
jgi:hypothetical protein